MLKEMPTKGAALVPVLVSALVPAPLPVLMPALVPVLVPVKGSEETQLQGMVLGQTKARDARRWVLMGLEVWCAPASSVASDTTSHQQPQSIAPIFGELFY